MVYTVLNFLSNQSIVILTYSFGQIVILITKQKHGTNICFPLNVIMNFESKHFPLRVIYIFLIVQIEAKQISLI